MKQYRSILQVAPNLQGRTITGTAIVFDSWSNKLFDPIVGVFQEKIERGALTQETLDNSDIVATMGHDKNYVMARSKYGKGNLQLILTDEGLNFRFDCPETVKGEELLQHIKRGEMDSCSFAFTNPEDGERWYKEDGMLRRSVTKIDKIYDVSIVFYPAYEETSVSARSVELAKQALEKNNDSYMNDENEKIEIRETEETPQAAPEATEIQNEQEVKPIEENATEEPETAQNETVEETVEKNNPETEQKSEETPVNQEIEKPETREININEKNKQTHNVMKKHTLLQQQIREAIENGTNKVEFRSAVDIVSVNKNQGTDTMVGLHDDVVEEEIKDFLQPLYAESVFSKLGLRMYSGLPMGDIRVPAMTGGTAEWEYENADAEFTSNEFSSVILKPKRITAYIDISKMLIAQDTLNVESMIRRDLYNALMSKVQKTFLGSAAGTAYKPAGIFYNVTPENITSYAELCEMEANVADSNLGGAKKYLMDNHAYAVLRSMPKSVLTNQLTLTNGNVDGTEIITSSDVATNNYAYGAWDSIVFGSWGDVDLIIDPYTQARKGAVRLVINAYFDWAKTRESEGVMAYGTITEPELIDSSNG